MQIMLDSKENCDRENTKKKKIIKNVHYIYIKKNKQKLHYTALLLWLQSRLNNFTAFYSHPLKKKLYEMSKSRGIVAIFLLESRNK